MLIIYLFVRFGGGVGMEKPQCLCGGAQLLVVLFNPSAMWVTLRLSGLTGIKVPQLAMLSCWPWPKIGAMTFFLTP